MGRTCVPGCTPSPIARPSTPCAAFAAGPRACGLDGLPAGREPSQPAHELPDDGLWLQVRSLPGKQRTAVVHRFVMDLDYRSIGELMGTTEEAARQNVRAGLQRLRKEMDR